MQSRKLDGACIAGRIWGRADGNSGQWDTDGVCPGLDCRAFMTFILCCPVGTYAKLRPPPIPPRVISGDWMASDRSYNSWAGAVEFCVAQSSGGLSHVTSNVSDSSAGELSTPQHETRDQ